MKKTKGSKTNTSYAPAAKTQIKVGGKKKGGKK